MTNTHRWLAAAAVMALGAGCQLVSGLDGLHHGSTGAGGASTSTGPSTTGGGTTGSTSSSTTGSTGSTTSVTSSSSGCTGSGCPCDAGQCTPVVVAHSAGMPASIASDGTRLYWSVLGVADASDGAIYWKLISDPPASVASLVTMVDPEQMVSDGKLVSWFDKRPPFSNMGIHADDVDGGMPAKLYQDNTVAQLAEVAGKLYWISKSGISTMPAKIPSVLTGAASLSPPPQYFSVDTTDVYWTDTMAIYKTAIPTSTADAGVLDAGAPLYSGNALTEVIADSVPNGKLYWRADMIYFANKDGSGVTPAGLLVPGDTVSSWLIDDSNVYWFESVDACTAMKIAKMPAGGGAPVPFASLPDGCINVIAQDKTSLYWAQANDIYRLAK